MNAKKEMNLDERIDAIESAYEFMLAYAAQGRQSDQGGGAASDLRGYLRTMDAALDGLAEVVDSRMKSLGKGSVDAFEPFLEAVRQDAARALAIVRIVMAKSAISSQLIDNVNASIHLRALLTDLFVVDESLKHEG
jgi:hypothetical protein